jgi:hypothetical protein
MMNNRNFHAGDWVEVRSKEEILKTLDGDGRLEGLPFMPQMFQSCGRRFQIFKRAHKTCDTVTGDYQSRRMNAAVHLEGSRCDGQAYGGCQAACLIFWKDAWLKKVADGGAPAVGSASQTAPAAALPASGCREEDVWAGTKDASGENGAETTYVCQATVLPAATERLTWWNIKQYVEDLESGNIGVDRMARGFLYMGFRSLANAGIGLGKPLRWLYNTLQGLWGGVPYPRRQGKIPAGVRTPHSELNLQPGERVRVKSYEEILATLDAENRNRGLFFDAEMVPYCGRSFVVMQRVNKIVNEKTGKMMEFKNPCIILAGAVCEARYSECRLFCPRAIYSYWREIWLERESGGAAGKMTSQ